MVRAFILISSSWLALIIREWPPPRAWMRSQKTLDSVPDSVTVVVQ